LILKMDMMDGYLKKNIGTMFVVSVIGRL